MTRFVWVLAAAVAALAAFVSLRHGTPVDLSLPLIAAAVTLLAAASYPSIMLAVPLLIAAGFAFPADGIRLLAFGVVLAAAFATACAFPRREAGEGVERALAITAAAILLLRWIPLGEVVVGRELALGSIALLIVVVLDGTPFAVALAVYAALLTPAVPLRTFALPLAVLAFAVAARLLGLRSPRLAWVAAPAIAAAMLFFAWSGVFARAMPYFFRSSAPARIAQPLRIALAASESLTLDVPRGASSLVLSGANVASLRRGATLGRIEPGGRAIRVGDAADWGYVRREQFFASRNPLPRDPAGKLRGFGIDSWVDGAGRVSLPRGAASIRIVADPSLPAGASLQIEGFESGAR